MPNRTPHVLALAAVLCTLCGCATSSNPELVALKDATVYRDTELADLPDNPVKVGIGGVRAVEGGALIDVVLCVRAEHNRINRIVDAFAGGPEAALAEVRRNAAISAGALDWGDNVSTWIRLTGDRGQLQLVAPTVNAKDPNATTLPLILGETVYPLSCSFQFEDQTWVVQPLPVRTAAPLEAGWYTVELSPEFVRRLSPGPPGTPEPAGISARRYVDRGATPTSDSRVPDGF